MGIKLENKEICSACGGKCCKKCGCDYAPQDFENMSIDYLQSKLEEGNISITSTLFFDELKNGQITCVPFLYLRARNINRPIVDLISMKTGCSVLKDDGCPYEFKNRPTGARNVVPTSDFNCYSNENPKDLIIEPWSRYQKILSRLVKRMTGYSVDAKLSIDIENLFRDIKNANFEGVSKDGLEEMIELIPILSEVYKEEFEKAMKNTRKDLRVDILLKTLNKKFNSLIPKK